MKGLFKQIGSARKLLVISIGFGILTGLFILLQATTLAAIIDGAFLQEKDLQALLPLLWLLLLWLVLRMMIQTAGEWAASAMTIRIKQDLRSRLVRHLAKLGPHYMKRERSGELIHTVYAGIEHLDAYLAKYIPQAAYSMIIPFAIGITVLGLDLVTTAVFIVTLPLLILFMILIGIGAKAMTDRQWRTLGLLGGHFMDILKGLTTLKLYNRSKAQIEIIRGVSERYRKTTMGTLRVAFLSAFVMELFATLSTAIIAVFLGLRLISGEMDFRSAFLILLLAPDFYAPIRQLGTQYHAAMNGISAAKRIFEILDTKPLGWTEEDGGSKQLPAQKKGYAIEFDQVSFRYPDSEQDVLKNVSFRLEQGHWLAIAGPTGSGKSTLLELLMGYLKPTSGRILIEGVDLAELSIQWWREQLAPVAQRVHLFHGTLQDNLTIGHAQATATEVQDACRDARLDQLVATLPEGLETIMDESVRLSGGQVQRIAIARALLKPSPVWLFDEATAQLDVETEQMIQHTLNPLLAARTAITVAHRLAVTREADHLLVLQDGEVVETGTHETLLQQQGLYASMLQAEHMEGAAH
ncbi:thiol reductant ABC exporter subunit CydD [Marinicrinis sediminis]|uniref:Thiol reductant ABC exporter subunit CydD n=1 Tax=Marinicrinis sediminis TaxID=1652465 RepID=A0ABW5R7E2_9BACL